MIDGESVISYLLDRRLIDRSGIIDGYLEIRCIARRNRNLEVKGPGGAGRFLKQPDRSVKGGRGTIAQEAAFHHSCRSHPGLAPFLEHIPRLVEFDETQPVLIFDLISDAAKFASFLESDERRDVAVEAAFTLGSTLGMLHRLSRSIAREQDGLTAWLHREPPWVLGIRHPGIAWLAGLTPAHAETLRILRTEGTFAARYGEMASCWRTEAVIHGDVRFDNVLIQTAGIDEAGGLKVWIVDWEMVQFGDPAWDVAGALQDFLVHWVWTMPLEGDLSAEERVARARRPLASLRTAIRALWSGYRRGSGLEPDEAGALLSRAVAYSSARLIQSAYEAAAEADRLPGESVILLQLAANVLADPETRPGPTLRHHPERPAIMSRIHDDLLIILDAVQIESTRRYNVLAEPREVPAVDQPSPATQAQPGQIISALAGDLYDRLYIRPSPSPLSIDDVFARRDLVAALSDANTGRGHWEPGWTVVEGEDGEFTVIKDGLVFWVPQSRLRPGEGAIRPGRTCRVLVPKELRGLFPGFYMTIGDGGAASEDEGEDVGPTLRYYWHLRPEAAVLFMATATALLNEVSVPFRLKVVSDPNAYSRADAGVLYVRGRDLAIVGPLVAQVHSTIAHLLRPEVPLFTKRLADGLGFAEDVARSKSFGQQRCRLVAEALWQSFVRGETDRDARIAALAAAFLQAGLDALYPHRGPGWRSEFEPEPLVPACSSGSHVPTRFSGRAIRPRR